MEEYYFYPATLLKVTLLHGCFSRFFNCTNGTKLRNASYIYRPWKVYDYDFYNRASDIQRGIIGLSDENEMCTFMMKTVPKMRRSIYHPDPSLLLQYFVLIKICSLLILLSDALQIRPFCAPEKNGSIYLIRPPA